MRPLSLLKLVLVIAKGSAYGLLQHGLNGLAAYHLQNTGSDIQANFAIAKFKAVSTNQRLTHGINR